jgi:hypothetical protein
MKRAILRRLSGFWMKESRGESEYRYLPARCDEPKALQNGNSAGVLACGTFRIWSEIITSRYALAADRYGGEFRETASGGEGFLFMIAGSYL